MRGFINDEPRFIFYFFKHLLDLGGLLPQSLCNSRIIRMFHLAEIWKKTDLVCSLTVTD